MTILEQPNKERVTLAEICLILGIPKEGSGDFRDFWNIRNAASESRSSFICMYKQTLQCSDAHCCHWGPSALVLCMYLCSAFQCYWFWWCSYQMWEEHLKYQPDCKIGLKSSASGEAEELQARIQIYNQRPCMIDTYILPSKNRLYSCCTFYLKWFWDRFDSVEATLVSNNK